MLIVMWLSNSTFHLLLIWLQSCANFICNWFRIKPGIFSELLQTTTPAPEVAVLFSLNLSRHSFLGQLVIASQCRSAALHSHQIGTCGFVPMSHFYWETHFTHFLLRKFEWSNGHSFWKATTSSLFHLKFHFTKKKWVVMALNLQSMKAFLLSNWASIVRVVAHIPQVSRSLSAEAAWKHPVFVLASLNSPSCAGAQPKELGHFFPVKTFDCLLE